MDTTKTNSPILLKYLDAYERNPKSKVFAPLAESYRKLGMLDEAMDVLKKGIQIHPTYTFGYLGLAACYFDQSKFELAYNTLRPLVADNLDSILMQKLFANTCEKLGHEEEALETYKYLLFINPRAKNIASSVKNLEEKLHICIDDLAGEDHSFHNFEIDNLSPSRSQSKIDTTDDWVEVNFTADEKEDAPKATSEANWEMKDVSRLNKAMKEESLQMASQENIKNYSDQDVVKWSEKTPVMTNTLVDLYLKQGLTDKAKEILLEIIQIDPKNKLAREKLGLLTKNEDEKEEGHNQLMAAYDKRVLNRSSNMGRLEQKFSLFLEKINSRKLGFFSNLQHGPEKKNNARA